MDHESIWMTCAHHQTGMFPEKDGHKLCGYFFRVIYYDLVTSTVSKDTLIIKMKENFPTVSGWLEHFNVSEKRKRYFWWQPYTGDTENKLQGK